VPVIQICICSFSIEFLAYISYAIVRRIEKARVAYYYGRYTDYVVISEMLILIVPCVHQLPPCTPANMKVLDRFRHWLQIFCHMVLSSSVVDAFWSSVWYSMALHTW